MNVSLNGKLVIVPYGLRDSVLSLRRQNPTLDFLLFSYEELEGLLGFRAGDKALGYLVGEKGYTIAKAEKTLSAICKIGKTTAKGAFFEKISAIRDELLEKGLLYAHPNPRLLLEHHEPLVYGYPKCRKLEKLIARLGLGDATYVPLSTNERVKPARLYDDFYMEGLALLSETAKLLRETDDPRKVHIYGLSGNLREFFMQEAPAYGFSIPRNVALSDTLLFREFISGIGSGDDEKRLEDLFSGLAENTGARQLASLVNSFSSIKDLDRRKALYMESARAVEVGIPAVSGGPGEITSPYVPEEEKIIVVSAYLGTLPRTSVEDTYFKDEYKELAGLPTSVDEAELRALEGGMLLRHRGLVYSSLNKEGGKPSYLYGDADLLPSDVATVTENGGDAVLFGFLKDLQEQTLNEDPRINVLLEKRPDLKDIHGTFPYDFGGNGDRNFARGKAARRYSYSGLKIYRLCPFSYYLSHVLGLKDGEDNFGAFVGNFFHHMLKLRDDPSLDAKQLKDKAASEAAALRKEPLSEEEKVLFAKVYAFADEMLKRIAAFEDALGYRGIEREARFDFRQGGFSVNGSVDEIIHVGGPLPYDVLIDFKTGTEKFDPDIFRQYRVESQLPIYSWVHDASSGPTDQTGAALIFPLAPAKASFWPDSWSQGTKNKRKADLPKVNGILLDEPRVYEPLNASEIVAGATKFKDDGTVRSAYRGISQSGIDAIKKEALGYLADLDSSIQDGEFAVKPVEIKKTGDNACANCPFRDVCYRRDGVVEHI